MKEIYRDIVEHQVLPSAKQLFANHYVFMHDNNPKHTSKNVKFFFEDLESN